MSSLFRRFRRSVMTDVEREALELRVRDALTRHESTGLTFADAAQNLQNNMTTREADSRATYFREAATLLRAYPEYRGVMRIASEILREHATLPHEYKSLLCQGFDHARCMPDGYMYCKGCAAPCSCRCHRERP